MMAFLFARPLLIVGVLLSFAVGLTIGNTAGRWTGTQIGREQGAAAERIVHEEQRRKAEAKADEDRRSAQAKIDAVEADYLKRDAARSAEMAGLERALQEEQDATPIPTPSPGAACVCRPAMPRGVSDALRSLGAPASRSPATEPHGALR